MSRTCFAAFVAAVVATAGCIADENARPYDEFAEEYLQLLDAGVIGGETDSATDASGPDSGEADAGQSGFQPDPTWPDCSLEQAGEQVEVTFVNDTGIGGALYWVDPACEEVEVGLVPAGEELPQVTFVGHRFRLRIVRDDRRVVGGAYVADAVETRLNLSGGP